MDESNKTRKTKPENSALPVQNYTTAEIQKKLFLLINFTPKLVSILLRLAAFLPPCNPLLEIVTHYDQFTAELIN